MEKKQDNKTNCPHKKGYNNNTENNTAEKFKWIYQEMILHQVQ